MSIKQDPSGYIGIYATTGAEIAFLYPNPATGLQIQQSVGNLLLGSVGIDAINQLTLGKVTFYQGTAGALIATAGVGIPPIYAATTQNAVTNAAPTSMSYTPPAVAGTYRISGYVNVTTGTTIILKLKLTYSTPTSNAVTDLINFQQQGSATFLLTLVAAGRYYFNETFQIDNTATAIVLADNAGTYTTCAYNLVAALEQLA